MYGSHSVSYFVPNIRELLPSDCQQFARSHLLPFWKLEDGLCQLCKQKYK